jgi:ribosome biogenesis protein Nip4
MATTVRKINYFEILPDYKDRSKEKDFHLIFTHINTLSKNKDTKRYVHLNDRVLFVTDINFDAVEKRIRGKIYNIRSCLKFI